MDGFRRPTYATGLKACPSLQTGNNLCNGPSGYLNVADWSLVCGSRNRCRAKPVREIEAPTTFPSACNASASPGAGKYIDPWPEQAEANVIFSRKKAGKLVDDKLRIRGHGVEASRVAQTLQEHGKSRRDIIGIQSHRMSDSLTARGTTSGSTIAGLILFARNTLSRRAGHRQQGIRTHHVARQGAGDPDEGGKALRRVQRSG